MKPPANVEKYRRAKGLPPKQHAAVYAPAEKIRETLAIIQAEDPTFASSNRNIEAIFDFLWENDVVGGWSLENVRKAVQILSYPADKLERVQPRPAPPPPPVAPEPEPEEILEPGQLSIHASEAELRKASPAQLKDFLKRARTKSL